MTCRPSLRSQSRCCAKKASEEAGASMAAACPRALSQCVGSEVADWREHSSNDTPPCPGCRRLSRFVAQRRQKFATRQFPVKDGHAGRQRVLPNRPSPHGACGQAHRLARARRRTSRQGCRRRRLTFRRDLRRRRHVYTLSNRPPAVDDSAPASTADCGTSSGKCCRGGS